MKTHKNLVSTTCKCPPPNKFSIHGICHICHKLAEKKYSYMPPKAAASGGENVARNKEGIKNNRK